METHHVSAPIFSSSSTRPPSSSSSFRIPKRRIKLSIVRLGSGAKRRSFSGKRILLGFFRRLRLKWLVRHYREAIEGLRKVYKQMLKDVVAGTASMEMLRAHTSLDYHFAAPFDHRTGYGSGVPNYRIGY